jgi:hypothetical protein
VFAPPGLGGRLLLRVLAAAGGVGHDHGTTVEQAFGLIRAHARNHNVTVKSVVEAIVALGMPV